MIESLQTQISEKIKNIKREVLFQYVRSTGPGGQNVNKTNSAVQLRWNVDQSQCLSLEEKQVVFRKLSHFINKEGELILKTTESRDQKQNIEITFEKLAALLVKAFTKPKRRIKTKPTRSSKERRIQHKKLLSDKKDMRRKNYD